MAQDIWTTFAQSGQEPQRLFHTTSNSSSSGARSEYERDYDRIIYSNPFRRLQGKTQVFPLPGVEMVHNRLTHSLEVASLGRSLASKIAETLISKVNESNHKDFYKYQFPQIVAAACLAHDLGNPPFGHSGEEAVRAFFENYLKDDELTELQRNDFLRFDGNANTFRILTKDTKVDELKGGAFNLTALTLISTIKYPWTSNHEKAKKGKFNYFQSEEIQFKKIYAEVYKQKICCDYPKHPFAYVMEAADDICYSIIDLEDAFRLNLISFQEILDILILAITKDDSEKVLNNIKEIKEVDMNEALSYLRAKAINSLTDEFSQLFQKEEFNFSKLDTPKSLKDSYKKSNISDFFAKAEDISRSKVYSYKPVLKIELAGYEIIKFLLKTLVNAFTSSNKNKFHKKVLGLISPNYHPVDPNDKYTQLLLAMDYVTGMTDAYALDLYKTLKGNSIPEM